MRILSRIPNNMKTPGTSVPFVPAGGICYMALAVLATFTSPSLAQSAPDAGGVLRETAPPQKVIPPSPEVVPGRAVPAKPTAAPGGTAVMVRAIRFSGNTLFSSEELQPLMAERIGQPNTLADLEALAMRVTEKYRAAGYMLAQAIVPVQDVTAGEIEISVIEGVLGRVRIEVDPAAPIKPAVVERIASRLNTG
ncbi:MAG: ShlB/FhaC/HecB family hemolysin secretion/activation protein [Thermomicrobiales bacterium]|nr:MAG: ShlB/FhaC/HecB family hemolysin secretion/activation protein [Thermomicrobiales bacterium]